MSQSQQLTIKQAISRAKKAAKQGDVVVAQQLYNLVLQRQPNHLIARKGLRKLKKKLQRNQSGQTQMTNPSQDKINALINLYHSGQVTKAEQACRELLQSYPQSLIVFNLLGAALKVQGKLQEAVQAFDKAIQLKPDYAEAYSNRGGVLKELGQLEKAVESYDKAIQLKPDYVEAYSNLGVVLKELGQLEKAVESCDKAIQLKPDLADAYYNRGVVLKELGQLEKAVESYDKAIQLKPDYAVAYSNRGGVLKELGQLEKAVESYDKAIQLKPDYAEAHRNLSALKKYKSDDTQIELMESLFTDSEPSESDRMHLCFALAKSYEDLGEYDKSFNYIEEGNRHRKKELKYNINDSKAFFTKIRKIFTTGSLALEVPPDGNSSIHPVFIVGMPRSGTSLVEQILASHTKVYGGGELNAMDELVGLILSKLPGQNNSQEKSKLSMNEIKTVRDGYLEALTALKVSEKIITDKMPLNFILVGFMLSAFPEAKIIHLNRDSKATCWSIYKQYFSAKGNGFAYDMGDLVKFYKLYIDLMSFWRERFPNSIYDLCYEDLTENQEEETRRLLEYCDLEWEEQCLDFHKMKRVVRTASAVQVRKKMYKGSSEAWRKYEGHLQPLINGLEL